MKPLVDGDRRVDGPQNEESLAQAPGGAAGEERGEPEFLSLRELELRHIGRVLEATGGNQRQAARILGVSRWALARRLRKHGLKPPRPRSRTRR